MRKVVFLFLFICTFAKVLAETTFFTFSPAANMIFSTDKIVHIDFFYDISGLESGDFLVRPVFENGTVEIFDQDLGIWVSQTSLWSVLPCLKNEMKIRILSHRGSPAEIYFRIQNKLTGEIYDTPAEKIWFENSYQDYVKKVNTKLSLWEGSRDSEQAYEISGKIGDEGKDYRNTYIGNTRKIYIPISVASFAISGAIAFLSGNNHNRVIKLHDEAFK